MPEPEQVSRWYQALLPIVEKGGPVLSLLLLVTLIVSLWWLTGWLRECVGMNRALTERLLAQQQSFTQEIRLALTHCQRNPE
jgi:hypothetical protein